MSSDKKAGRSKKTKVKGLFKDDDASPQVDHSAKAAKTISSVIKRTGYMEIREKDTWKVMFCLLVEGSLFLYKNSTVRDRHRRTDKKDPEPCNEIALKGLLITDASQTDKKYCFAVVRGVPEGNGCNSNRK